MAQRSPPHRGRALIVEDEILFALNLEAEMHTLGFDICDLAANGHQASTLAMSNVVLMDINLEGGREGIEVGRCLHTMYEAPVVFISGYTDRDSRAHPRTSAGRANIAQGVLLSPSRRRRGRGYPSPALTRCGSGFSVVMQLRKPHMSINGP